MWTHVKVTVCKARALISKGKDGTNDALVKIALGKEKYQTSVKERAIAADSVVWNEECELAIPKQGNKAEIVLTALHRNRNFIGDEFLGAVNIPLSDFADAYDRPISKWYSLNSKAGKPNTKQRGELEVRIQFSMKTPKAGAGSLSDLTEKERHRSSLGRLATSLGGSLFSLGKDKEKKEKKNKNQKGSSSTLPGRGKGQGQFGAIPEQEIYKTYIQTKYDADPGVISDDDGEGDDEFKFEELSHKSSKSSLSVFQDPLPLPLPVSKNVESVPVIVEPVPKPRKVIKSDPQIPKSHSMVDISLKAAAKSDEKEKPKKKITLFSPSKPKESDYRPKSTPVGITNPIRVINQQEGQQEKEKTRLPKEILRKFDGISRDDLIETVTKLQSEVDEQKQRMKEMSDYIDNLLVRIMEVKPTILQSQSQSKKIMF